MMPVQLVSDYNREGGPLTGGEMPPGLLMAEANHRIANNLTLIAGWLRLQSRDVNKDGRPLSAREACNLLEEAGSRIETVGRLHRLLAHSGQAATLELRQYLHDVAEAAIDSMSVPGVTTLERMPSAACQIPTHHALSVGFIVGELVTNAVKYAHPAGVSGRVELSCHRRPGGATLIQIVDDGVGLPEDFDPRKDGGLGLRMVRTLADQLGATLTFDSAGFGLAVGLLLPPYGLVSAA